MLREARLVAALPSEVPHADVRDAGSGDDLSWVLSEWVEGTTLDEVWSTVDPTDARRLLDEVVAVLAVLHAWTPPFEVSCGDEADDALGVAGRTVVPFRRRQVELMGGLARTLPFVDPELIDAGRDRVARLLPRT